MKLAKMEFCIRCLVLVIVGSSNIAAARKNNWKHFHSSDFPAYIQTIEFKHSQMSPSTDVSWGAWTVGFKNGAYPIMRFCGDQYVIQGLIAYNDVKGKKDATITFIDNKWIVAIDDGGLFGINPPKEIIFKH